MTLFGKKKSDWGKASDDCCSVKVLGTGCKSCHQQYEFAKEAVKSLGLSIEVEYITDMQKIMEYGVMSTPALVINESIVSWGRILKPNEIVACLNKPEA